MRLLLLLLVIGFVLWLLSRKPQQAADEPQDLERQLLHLCLGDRALAERLIAAELARAPGIDRARAIDRAYGQLSRAKR
jgi:hypothetical protein